VSATNGCVHCLDSHITAARKPGADAAMRGELMAAVGVVTRTGAPADAETTRAAARGA
jgi:AhpD family alkylhydroperoxidase